MRKRFEINDRNGIFRARIFKELDESSVDSLKKNCL